MKSLLLKIVASVLFASPLVGCLGANSVTAFPVKEATWVVSGLEYRGPAPPLLDRSGTGPSFYPYPDRPAPARLIVGYANHVTPGAPPVPRDKRVSHLYQGLVKFNLEDPLIQAWFNNEDFRLSNATLIIQTSVLASDAIEGITIQQTAVRSMRRGWSAGFSKGGTSSVVALATSSRDDEARYVPPASLAARPGSESVVRVNVTDLVRKWSSGTLANNGIMLRPNPAQITWNSTKLVHACETELKLTFSRR